MLDFVINNFLLIYLLEIGAAIAGNYFLKKNPNPASEDRLFVNYLWLTVFVETVGFYPTYAYFTEYATLPFLKDSLFERNYWWYNIYTVIKFAIFYIYFIKQIQGSSRRSILKIIASLFVISFVINLIFSGDFFLTYSTYSSMAGTFLLMILIFLYFIDLLRSNKILQFDREISFYIAVGLLIWHVSVTPLFIYNNYFSLQSPDFVYLHSWILKTANIFLYGVFIAGFIICSRKLSVYKG